MNYSPKRFTNPGLLRRIGFPQLIQLLEPHKAFFDTKPGFCWAYDSADFSFEILAKIMMNLDHTAPAELFESLYFAEFFGNSGFFDHLLDIAEENGIHVKDFWTPIDLAIHLWFECRDDLQRCHASLHCRGSVTRPRRFESFFVREEVCSIFAHDDTTIATIQDELNQWATNGQRRTNGGLVCGFLSLTRAIPFGS